MNQQVHTTIHHLIDKLRSMQANDGSWRFCFESGPMTDAYTIILLRTLEYENEEWLIKQLVRRLLHKQEDNGAWKLFEDEKEGNLSATVEAYYALLYSGYINTGTERMELAKDFILKHYGLTKTNTFTKSMLALTGQLPWPKHLQIPIEVMLIPQEAPISFYDLVGYARAHFSAILVSSNKDFSYQTKRTPDLSNMILERFPNDADLNSEDTRFIMNKIKDELKKLTELPKKLRELAYEKAEQYIIDRIEPDGLLYSYVSATFYMVFAFLALKYKKDHPYIREAVEGIKNQLCLSTEYYHIENSTSTVWDTSLLSHSLQRAGVGPTDEMIQKSSHYLLLRQHLKFGDWVLHNTDTVPGGWGFSDINTFIPDVDDTTAALRAVKMMTLHEPQYRESWSRGLDWLLSMQNSDGGWAAFEKNTDNILIKYLPYKDSERTFIDPSTADLTGRTLAYLGNEANMLLPHPILEKAIQWLEANQEKDGSWYGRWGICYIYGTWAAITGMRAVGVSSKNSSIIKAVSWLKDIQNEDGGWGESCYSDINMQYVPLRASTPSQTAWALDALIAVSDTPTKEIDAGISFLIESIEKKSWTASYPTGAGLPGSFYIQYHSYNYIWPLLTLSNYQNKYAN